MTAAKGTGARHRPIEIAAPERVDVDTSDGGQTLRSDIVFEALREALREGRMKAGERVKEAELAQTLGVSRTPVREALKRLELQGLIVNAPGIGFVVRKLTPNEVVQLHAVWGALQGLAARLAAQHITDAGFLMLEGLFNRLERTIKAEPLKALAVAHALDRLIGDAAHNSYLVQHIEQLMDHMNLIRSRGTTFQQPERPSAFLAEVRDIVGAIKARDADWAEAAARRHIHQGLIARLSLDFGLTEPMS